MNNENSELGQNSGLNAAPLQPVKPVKSKKKLYIVLSIIALIVLGGAGWLTYSLVNGNDNDTNDTAAIYRTNEGKAAASLIDSFKNEEDILIKSAETQHMKRSTTADASIRRDLGEDKL